MQNIKQLLQVGKPLRITNIADYSRFKYGLAEK